MKTVQFVFDEAWVLEVCLNEFIKCDFNEYLNIDEILTAFHIFGATESYDPLHTIFSSINDHETVCFGICGSLKGLKLSFVLFLSIRSLWSGK